MLPIFTLHHHSAREGWPAPSTKRCRRKRHLLPSSEPPEISTSLGHSEMIVSLLWYAGRPPSGLLRVLSVGPGPQSILDAHPISSGGWPGGCRTAYISHVKTLEGRPYVKRIQ